MPIGSGMTEASGIDTGKPRRRTGFYLAAAMAIVIVLAAGIWIKSGLAFCGPLDRLLTRSNCITEITVADFSPLPFIAMVPRYESTVWVHGYGPGDPAPPVRLLVDLGTGAVIERQEMAFLARTVYRLSSSLDGRRMAIACMSGVVCDGLAPQGRIFSAETGEVIEDIPNAAAWGGFPNEPQIPYEAATLADRGLIAYADADTGGIVLREALSQEEVGQFVPPYLDSNRYAPPSELAARASPSGDLVAVIKSPRSGGSSRIDIWDIEGERLLDTVIIHARGLETSAAWTPDERHLLVLRSDGTSTGLYVLAVPER